MLLRHYAQVEDSHTITHHKHIHLTESTVWTGVIMSLSGWLANCWWLRVWGFVHNHFSLGLSMSQSQSHKRMVSGLLEMSIMLFLPLQVPSNKTLPWYQGTQRMISRHPLNNRRQDTVLATYTKSVQQKGIVRGVRGECWLQAPDTDSGETSYLALTFATLWLSFIQFKRNNFFCHIYVTVCNLYLPIHIERISLTWCVGVFS